jgi:hypothetical protein
LTAHTALAIMFTVRKLTGNTWAEALDPSFRKVDFSSMYAVVLVSTTIRRSWQLLPEVIKDHGESTYENTIPFTRQLIGAINETSDDDLAAFVNPDREIVHTPFRDAIYEVWNHVFIDVSRFLSEVNCKCGEFKPPSVEAVGVRYLEDGQARTRKAEGDMTKVVEMEMLSHRQFAPAFLDPGVKLAVVVGGDSKETFNQEEDKDEARSFLWDATSTEGLWNGKEVLWVKGGQKIQIYLGGNLDQSRKGLAAVLACGRYQMEDMEDRTHMSLDGPREEDEENEEEVGKDAIEGKPENWKRISTTSNLESR